MCWKEDKSLMIKSYRLLYDIENIMAEHIIDRFHEHYGKVWLDHLNLDILQKANYSALVKYFVNYPYVFPHIKISEYKLLLELIPIRNNICHMNTLSNEEFKYLKTCHRIINLIIKRKIKNEYLPINL